MSLHRPPVARIPIEMIQAIFEAGPDFPESRMDFASSVSQVSRLWRQIAMHTPFIWSSVLLHAECTERWQELLKMRIRLSRSHPLDIAVELYHFPEVDPEFPNALSHQLNLIIPEISRWKSVTYCGSLCVNVFSFFEPLALLSAPLLEVLDVQAGLDEEEYIDDVLRVFTGGAPRLSRVMIDGIKLSSCLPPISSLTSIALYNSPGPIDFALFKEVLTTSALTSIELHADVIDEGRLYDLAAEGQSIELPSLRSFFVMADIFPKYQFFSLLIILRCPGLETMTVAATQYEDSSPDIRPRHNYKLPTYTSLRSLKLICLDCTRLCADFDINRLPALTDITFDRCSNAMAFLNALVPTAEREVGIWPLLKLISFDAGTLHHDDVNELGEVLSYRNQCGGPIECVRFDIVGDCLIANGNYVGALQEHVRIEIHCVSPSAHSIVAMVH
jgi:hypothetical protein